MRVRPQTRTRPNRAQKREANRERILRAARKVFGQRGFHAATIEEIADLAGLSNGAIYYNFENKADLFLALAQERTDERIEHLRSTLNNPALADQLDAGLAEEARDTTRSLKESREWRLLLLEFVAHAARTPALRPKVRAHHRQLRTAVAEVLAHRYTSLDRTPPLPPDQLALTAIALANGLATAEIADPGSVPDHLLADLLTRLLAQPADTPPTTRQ